MRKRKKKLEARLAKKRKKVKRIRGERLDVLIYNELGTSME
jgi:hypothetical protein